MKIKILKGYNVIFIDDLNDFIDNGIYEDYYKDYFLRELRGLCDQYSVRFIVNTDISKRVHDRGGDYRPQYRDFNWSRELASWADRIYAYYRPGYFGIVEDEYGNNLREVEEWLTIKDE